MILTGETKVLGERKSCPSATLSTTNATLINPGSKPGLRVERPATDRLSGGTDLFKSVLHLKIHPVAHSKRTLSRLYKPAS